MLAVDCVVIYHAQGGQSGRLPRLLWTALKASMPTINSVGSLKALCEQHGRLPHTPWTAWEASMPPVLHA